MPFPPKIGSAPECEIELLFELFRESIARWHKRLQCESLPVSISFIGARSVLDKALRADISELEAWTPERKKCHVTIALNYGGRAELVRCVRRIVESGVNPESIDETLITENLETRYLPDPEIVIRTGKEQRISNFMLWQTAYAELFFSNVYWPDFTPEHLRKHLAQFASRERRYGGLGAIPG